MSGRRLSLSNILSVGALLGAAVGAPVQTLQDQAVQTIQTVQTVTVTACGPSPVQASPTLLSDAQVQPVTSTLEPLIPEQTSIPAQNSPPLIASTPAASPVPSQTIAVQQPALASSSIVLASIIPETSSTPAAPVKNPATSSSILASISPQASSTPAVSTKTLASSSTVLASISPQAYSTPALPVQTTAVASGTIAKPGIGQAIVHNTCGFEVEVQSVAGTQIGPVIALAAGSAHSENYHTGAHGTGVAVRCQKKGENWSDPMLLEYTPNFEMGMIFYDVSVSVGGKMRGNGAIGNTYSLTPSVTNQATSCVPVTHSNSYVHLGESDRATKSCALSTTITLKLC